MDTNEQFTKWTDRYLLTNRVGIKEEHGGSEDGNKHSVVKNSGGIHTEKESGDDAYKVDQDGRGSGTTINANPLIGGEEASGTLRPIPQIRDINCGTACPIGRKKDESFSGMNKDWCSLVRTETFRSYTHYFNIEKADRVFDTCIIYQTHTWKDFTWVHFTKISFDL